MRKLALAAAGLLCALAPVAASAADLYDGRGPSDRRAYVYEDPRYADIYREPRRAETPPPPPGYRPVPPPPSPYAYRVEPPRYVDPPRYSEAPRYAPPPRYVEPHRHAEPEARYARPEHCTDKEEIRSRLIEGGWRDFHDPQVRGPAAFIKARRANGDLYELRVDRCTGEVTFAQFLERGREYGPYAYDDLPPPRWRRSY